MAVTTLTVLAISASALAVGIPAAEAASKHPGKPACNKVLASMKGPKYDGARSSCEARILWESIDVAARGAAKQPDDASRVRVNAKYFWALQGPLIQQGDGNHDGGSYYAPRASSSVDSRAYLIILRDYVALNSRNYRHMKSSVMLLNAIDTVESGKSLAKKLPSATRNVVKRGLQTSNSNLVLGVVQAASIPMVKASYLEDSRNELIGAFN